ncbi:nucleoside monophosphate kinase, partial [Candidatus Saccharibacteria bacterium]|nr:nucleoside monophosphate kinase [Candidatus Saccharibacteria bacterium]
GMIVFMGVAGAGKSLQGRLLADEAGLPWLSTGQFLRMLISGQERKDMLVGKLLDDQEMFSLVQKIFGIVDTTHEFVLDGFPRTGPQADWLIKGANNSGPTVTVVINLQASEAVVRDRLLARGRLDDTQTAIHNRFEEYKTMTLPILDQFRVAGIPLKDINGDQTSEKVHQDIMAALQGMI